MKTDSLIDCLGYIAFRLLGPLARALPLNLSLFLARRLGDIFYYFDSRHKALAYANLKRALGDKLSPSQINRITRDFYQTFGQNFIEIFLLPAITRDYIKKYITFEGLEYAYQGIKKGKGVLFLAVHEGSWELYNIICANLGFPFNLFVRELRHPRLGGLLNSYRHQKGCKIIQRHDQLRELIGVLKNNEAVGMTMDQGGKAGILVKFFGQDASMSQGAIRLALKYDTTLIPGFCARIKGPYMKFIIEPPFELKKTEDKELDIRQNLQEIIHIFEKYITRYPKEYLWSYKIWKYTNKKNILILSDGKTGHLRQAEALAKITNNYLEDKGMMVNIDTVEVKFASSGQGKDKWRRYALTLSTCLAGKYRCQGCLWCLRRFLEKDTYKSLASKKPDVIISCGSAVAPVNFILSRENLAKSIVIMRPSILSTKRFNLVVMPRHDRPHKRNNIVAIEGALNLIDGDYLKEQVDKLMSSGELRALNSELTIGFLIGGDTKDFHLRKDLILEVIRQIKAASERHSADILITTSRRTAPEIEKLVKEEFQHYPHCKLLIIANEKNFPFTVGGILSLSQIVITSPESISMISEAVNSKKYVLGFNAGGLSKKHQRFLAHFKKNQYIYFAEPSDLNKSIADIWQNKPQLHVLKDDILIKEALKRIV